MRHEVRVVNGEEERARTIGLGGLSENVGPPAALIACQSWACFAVTRKALLTLVRCAVGYAYSGHDHAVDFSLVKPLEAFVVLPLVSFA